MACSLLSSGTYWPGTGCTCITSSVSLPRTWLLHLYVVEGELQSSNLRVVWSAS